jgi:hypothetical protein
MDTLETYRHAIEQILTEYAQIPYAYGNIQRQTVFDRNGDHYLLLSLGWEQRYIHGCVAHVDLINGKCWIQQDGTEYGIANELTDHGVPPSDIVLGFRSPEVRPYSGFATN